MMISQFIRILPWVSGCRHISTPGERLALMLIHIYGHVEPHRILVGISVVAETRR